MRFFSRFATVILWSLTVFSILAGLLGVASMLGFARLATVSDSSASPVAFEGSLAVAIQKESSEVQVGDFLLVGAHSAGGSTLGEVIALNESANGGLSVLLKAPGVNMPDQWSYELGSHTYQQVFAVPLVGYVFSALERFELPFVTVVLAAIVIAIFLMLFRHFFFKRPDENEPHWFAKLESEGDGEENLIALGEIFRDAGAPQPVLLIEEDTSWTRRRRA